MDLAAKTPPPERFQNHPSSDSNLLLSFTNGALKRHHHHAKTLYKECLKNHAAALGGHAIDGCGEFMPSPQSSPTDPTSLKCAACGCHRNFHRKSDDTDEEEEEEEDEDAAQFTPKRRNSSSPPHPLAASYSPSAPQILLALSAGHSGPLPEADNHHPLHHQHPSGNRPATPNVTPTMVRKRFRTKFTREQKEKMYDFAERLGWRMQRQEEGVVEVFCREIGIGKSVLKVWMHNHKNSYAKRNSSSTCNIPESSHTHNDNNNNENSNNTNNGNAADNNLVLNASSSSS